MQYVVQTDPEVAVRYGRLLSTLLDFIIVVFCLFLALRYAMSLRRQPAGTPAPSGKTKLLVQIRDELKSKRSDCDSAEQLCAASLSDRTGKSGRGENQSRNNNSNQ